MHKTISWHTQCMTLSLVCVLYQKPIFALQPLDVFVKAAHINNCDNQVAHNLVDQRSAETQVAKGRLLPSLSATGTYTRNEYSPQLVIPSFKEGITLTPFNQLDASINLSVPIVDIGAWYRVDAAIATKKASQASKQATNIDIDKQVAKQYYTLIGQEAVYQAAIISLDASTKNATLVDNRFTSGIAADLDVQRAKADVARAQQDVVQAQLQVALAIRALQTLTGLQPDDESMQHLLKDDLHDEAPLDTWLHTAAGSMPNLVAANAQADAYLATYDASLAAYLPTFSAAAQEKLSNATFLTGGHNSIWALSAKLSWTFDATIIANERAQKAAWLQARANADKVKKQVYDAIFADWQQIRADIAKSRAARAQVEATHLAANLARDKYTYDVATQLDVIQAQKDAFTADVMRIQADSDLLYQRMQLRMDAGQFVVPTGGMP